MKPWTLFSTRKTSDPKSDALPVGHDQWRGRATTPAARGREKWCDLVRTDARTRSKFEELVRTLGRPRADVFVEIHAERIASRLHVALASVKPDVILPSIQHEINTYGATLRYIDALFEMAREDHAENILRAWLNAGVRDDEDYYTDPDRMSLSPGWMSPEGESLARNVDRAANWICSGNGTTPYSHLIPKMRSLLVYHLDTRDVGHTLGPTGRLLRYIHRYIAPESPLHRCVELGTHYPSTVGGCALHDHIFRLTASIKWPPYDSSEWENYAVFFLASIVLAQGFAYANTRVARTMYSIVLLRNTKSFKAPTLEGESNLFFTSGRWGNG